MKHIDLTAVCFPAWEKEVARTYLQDRKISDEQIKKLWYIQDVSSLELLVNSKRVTKYDSPDVDKHRNPRDHDVRGEGIQDTGERILFPFERNGEIIGMAARHTKTVSARRYINYRFEGDAPLIFNYDGVNRNDTVLITEGPIDSMSLPNSIAMAGRDYNKVEEFKENSIIVFDNEPTEQPSYYKNKGAIDAGFTVCIWDSRVDGLKDINDMVCAGMSTDRIVDIIKSCAVSGEEALQKLSEYSEYE